MELSRKKERESRMATIIKSTSLYDITYYNNNAVYATAWGASSGDAYSRGNLMIGQVKSTFKVGRSYFWFDTSSLASDLVIASAKLYIYNRNTVPNYNNDFYIKVQRGTELDGNGIPVVHHTPVTYEDYNKSLVSGTHVGSVVFSGEGLDDVSSGGTFTGTVNTDYKIEIDSVDPDGNDTFKWSDDGGSTWNATLIPITGAAQTLNNGVTITFNSATGHTLGDYWTFVAYDNAGIIHASDIPEVEGYFSIELNQQGIDWINKGAGAISKFCLRTDKDIGGVAPTKDVNKYLEIRGAVPGDGSDYPYLEITTAAVTTEAVSQIAYDCAMGNGTATGDNITERGFEVKVAVDFFGVGPEIFWNLIGFEDEGEISYHSFGQRTGYLLKRETWTGTFEVGAFEGVLGKAILGSPSGAWNDALRECKSYIYRAWAKIDGTIYYGDWVAFDTLCSGAHQNDNDLPINIPPIIDVHAEYPDLEFYYRKAYKKKGLDELRQKCRTFSDNSVEYALTLNHNIRVLQQFLNMMHEIIDTDEYNNFKDIIPNQHLNALAHRELDVNDFKAIINNFIDNSINNTMNVNANFRLINRGLEDSHTTHNVGFMDEKVATKPIRESDPSIEILKKKIDALSTEMSFNYATTQHNLKVMRAILI